MHAWRVCVLPTSATCQLLMLEIASPSSQTKKSARWKLYQIKRGLQQLRESSMAWRPQLDLAGGVPAAEQRTCAPCLQGATMPPCTIQSGESIEPSHIDKNSACTSPKYWVPKDAHHPPQPKDDESLLSNSKHPNIAGKFPSGGTAMREVAAFEALKRGERGRTSRLKAYALFPIAQKVVPRLPYIP